MKKLICAALAASSMMVFAAEAEKAEVAAPAKPKITAEQRAQRKAMREKFLADAAAQKAELEKKMTELIKKYVPEEEKAKALLGELEQLVMSMGRRPRPMPRPQKKAPEAK